jgi:hypothetical protein
MKPSTTRSRKRQQQVEDGVYDGRYKTKVVPDKKKSAKKKRTKGFDPYEDFPETNSQGV